MRKFSKESIYCISLIIIFLYVVFSDLALQNIKNNQISELKNKKILLSDDKYFYFLKNNKIKKMFAKKTNIFKWSSDGNFFIFYSEKKHKIFIYDLVLRKIIYRKSINYFKEDEIIDFEFINNHKILIFFKNYDKRYAYSLVSCDIKKNELEPLLFLEYNFSTFTIKNMVLSDSLDHLLFYFGDSYKNNTLFVFDIVNKKVLLKLNNACPISWFPGKKGFLYYNVLDKNKNIVINKYDFYGKQENKIEKIYSYKFKNIYIIKTSHQKDLVYFITKEKNLSKFYSWNLEDKKKRII